ncbi:cysteine/glutathione ABC transporter membrane/ATP-binding component [Glycocaulis alkaliphilus]|uniref:Cysteine/glutathione ABC transporter membrane/ATP-binding component n=1 Tax=Glycocaulis alkaliphilus TaxID=1434191 RepID=A0A3T0E6M6_9PROT|nr:thiol reductant ABC exporter subunit CydC [Glycocaulis alkaliphilus]AZU03023.1 cysteine/glutathione ABC transporter membrane/ATP-binding component [Glycocaulis alkaliphilus]GGB70385.1 cysteine/glutathione ABC transporter ATP-binding protein/permease CydC [Glycocaulis alkaliphilus]
MKTLAFFLSLARPDRWWLRAGAVLAILTLLAGIGLLSLSGWFITAAAIAGAAGLGRSFNYLFASGGVRGFAMARTLGRYAERLATHEATFRILARLRLWVFDRAAPLVPAGLGGLRAGDLLSRVTGDVDALDGLYLRLVTPALSALFGALAVVLILAFTAPAAILPVIGLFILSGLGLPLLAAKLGQSAGESVTQSASDTRSEAADLIAGMAELKAYGAETAVLSRLDAASDSWISGQRRLAGLALMNTAVLAFAGPASFVAGFLSAAAAGASPPLAALAGFIAFGLFEAAAPLVLAGEQYGRTLSAAKRLKALDDLRPAMEEPQAPLPLPDGHDVVFSSVGFTYPGGQSRPALQDVSFALPEGGRLALVGASGSGKSSIIRLLMGFYAPDSGDIRLGGTDLAALGPARTRQRLSLVDQRADLLSTTVRANLLLARPDATESQLWQALEQARAADFVRALPDGLLTWIGEEGRLVSGGQARRIALARAFLRDAPVMLLDEPTEGLDSRTEAEFLDALDAWLDADKRRSVLIVTHRPALLARAREVLVMEHARIAQTGSVDALTAEDGAFNRLFAKRL